MTWVQDDIKSMEVEVKEEEEEDKRDIIKWLILGGIIILAMRK